MGCTAWSGVEDNIIGREVVKGLKLVSKSVGLSKDPLSCLFPSFSASLSWGSEPWDLSVLLARPYVHLLGDHQTYHVFSSYLRTSPQEAQDSLVRHRPPDCNSHLALYIPFSDPIFHIYLSPESLHSTPWISGSVISISHILFPTSSFSFSNINLSLLWA